MSESLQEKVIESARDYVENLINLARVPGSAVSVEHGDLEECIGRSSQGDLNVVGLPDNLDFEFMRRMVKKTRSTCIFVRDSGDGNALA